MHHTLLHRFTTIKHDLGEEQNGDWFTKREITEIRLKLYRLWGLLLDRLSPLVLPRVRTNEVFIRKNNWGHLYCTQFPECDVILLIYLSLTNDAKMQYTVCLIDSFKCNYSEWCLQTICKWHELIVSVDLTYYCSSFVGP